MRKVYNAVILITAFLVPIVSNASVSVRVDSSSSNIPTSFTTASTSKIIANAKGGIRGVYAFSTAATAIVLNCSAGADTAPSDTSPQNLYIPASGALAIDNWPVSGVCYIRSDGSAISSGKLYLMLGQGMQ